MASPTVRSTSNGVGTGTSTTVTYPATISAGDTLVLHFVKDGTGGITPDSGESFTILGNEITAQIMASGVWIKDADGTEDSTTFTVTHANERTTWKMYSIADAGTPTVTENNGESDTPVFSSHDHGSVADILWILAANCDARTFTVTAVTNYSNDGTQNSGGGGGGVSQAWADRAVTADQVEDPADDMTLNASDGWHTRVIAFPEAASGVSGTGAVTLGSLAVAGTGIQTNEGQGVVTLGSLAIVGTATQGAITGGTTTGVDTYQSAYAVKDITVNSWTSTDPTLWEAVGETAFDDADFISSSDSVNDACEIQLGHLSDPIIYSGRAYETPHFSLRRRKSAAGGDSLSHLTELIDPSFGVIATLFETEITNTTFATTSSAISAAALANITDWRKLSLKITRTGTITGADRHIDVSWVRIRIMGLTLFFGALEVSGTATQGAITGTGAVTLGALQASGTARGGYGTGSITLGALQVAGTAASPILSRSPTAHPQVRFPTEDVTVNNWTSTEPTLHQALLTDSSDELFISSSKSVNDACEVRLRDFIDPGTLASQVNAYNPQVHFKSRKNAAGGDSVNITCELVDPSFGVLATNTRSNIDENFNGLNFSWSGNDIDDVTDWGNLILRFTRSGTITGADRHVEITSGFARAHGVTFVLPSLAVAGTGTQLNEGQAALVLPALVVAGTGTGAGAISGTGSVTLGALVAAGTGTQVNEGQAAITLGALVASGTGTQVDTGVGVVTLGGLAVAGTGIQTNEGVAAIILPALVVAGTGQVAALTGTGVVTLGALTVSGTGVQTNAGQAALILPALQVVGTGAQGDITGSGIVTLGGLQVAGTGIQINEGQSALTLPALVVVGAGGGLLGTGTVTLGALVVSGTGIQVIGGVGVLTLGSLQASGTGTQLNEGQLAITLPALVVAGTGQGGSVVSGTGVVTLGSLVVSGTGIQVLEGQGAVQLGALIASGTATQGAILGQAALLLPSLVVSGIGTAPGVAVGTATVTLGALQVSGRSGVLLFDSGWSEDLCIFLNLFEHPEIPPGTLISIVGMVRDATGLTSIVSPVVSVTTDEYPDPPTVTIHTLLADRIIVSATPFTSPTIGAVHTETLWEVAYADDPGFLSSIVSYIATAAPELEGPITFLASFDPGRAVAVKAVYSDQFGCQSDGITITEVEGEVPPKVCPPWDAIACPPIGAEGTWNEISDAADPTYNQPAEVEAVWTGDCVDECP